MRAEILEKGEEGPYEDLVLRSREGMFYHGTKYKHALEGLLERTESHYLVVRLEGSPVGAMPVMVKESPRLGRVANSLPFWGSHGGFVLDPGLKPSVRKSVVEALAKGHQSLLADDFLSSTVISSSYDPDKGRYEEVGWHPTDSRVGQVLEFGRLGEDPAATFKKSARNAVGRARRAGLETGWGSGSDLATALAEGHERGILRLHGKPRPRSFFASLGEFFEADQDYRIYYARSGSEYAALLLVFYYKQTIEYFVPVISEEFRSLSPMNLLVEEVVKDGIKRGSTSLNFGGTRKNMDGVYRFKESFGAQERPYHYYNMLPRGMAAFKGLSEEDIAEEFEWFYVVPFESLKRAAEA